MSGIHIAMTESSTFTPTDLFAGSGEVRTRSSTFAASIVLAANAVIARNTSTGNLVQWAPAGSNGTNIAVGITCEAIDTTAGVATHPYYISGDFNIAALVWPSATDAQKEQAFDRSAISVRALA
jgi:hypothetical protein